MQILGYIRISTDHQDFDSQKHLLLEHAQEHKLLIDELMTVEVSSRKDTKQCRIDELLSKLLDGDMLIVAELSRLGRNMLETLIIINALSEKGVKIIFVRQPELSTTGQHGKLLLASYFYIAETERKFISMRTKDGLKAARAEGKLLGKRKGSKNRTRRLDPFKDQIWRYLPIPLLCASILKIVNHQLERPVSYNKLRYYVESDAELASCIPAPAAPHGRAFYGGAT